MGAGSPGRRVRPRRPVQPRAASLRRRGKVPCGQEEGGDDDVPPSLSASPGRLLSLFAHVCAEGTRDMHAQRVPVATGPRSFVSSRPETAPCASPSCSTPRRRLAGVPPPTPSDGRVPLFRSWACGNYSPRAITPLAAHLPRSWPPSSAPVLP